MLDATIDDNRGMMMDSAVGQWREDSSARLGFPEDIARGSHKRTPNYEKKGWGPLYVRPSTSNIEGRSSTFDGKKKNVEEPVAKKQRDIANRYKVYIRECRQFFSFCSTLVVRVGLIPFSSELTGKS